MRDEDTVVSFQDHIRTVFTDIYVHKVLRKRYGE
jgi:hypothetical protein